MVSQEKSSMKKESNLAKHLKKLEKEMGYRGCKNCANQIEPLRMCEWAERGGDGHLHLLCPRWEKRKEG